ncbi:unnamed protein product [Linum trigynum]|uniref:Uncharacterized protein n=1 Tax=Linum trigynum TaxID=586398 RepID=A0AAV2E9M6_9ROSI
MIEPRGIDGTGGGGRWQLASWWPAREGDGGLASWRPTLRWLLLPAVTGLDPGRVVGDRAGLLGCRARSRGSPGDDVHRGPSMVWPSGLDGGDSGGWLLVVTGEGREGLRSTKEEDRVWGGLGVVSLG